MPETRLSLRYHVRGARQPATIFLREIVRKRGKYRRRARPYALITAAARKLDQISEWKKMLFTIVARCGTNTHAFPPSSHRPGKLGPRGFQIRQLCGDERRERALPPRFCEPPDVTESQGFEKAS